MSLRKSSDADNAPGKCVINPLVGVDDLRLGMMYAEVVRLLGEPDHKRASPEATVAYWPRGVCVHFAPTAEFIEIARGMGISPELLGVEVFVARAEDVVRAMREGGQVFDADTEGGHNFIFRDIQIGLWRAIVPADAEDPDGHFFDSVGVGRRGYYG